MILRIQDQFEMSMNDLEIKFNIAEKSENLTEKNVPLQKKCKIYRKSVHNLKRKEKCS